METSKTEKSVIMVPNTKTRDPATGLKISQTPVEVPEVPGLSLIHDYITTTEETRLWNELDKLPWVVDFTRKLQYYGYRNELTKPYHLVPIPEDIPQCLHLLMERIVEDKLNYKRPEQVIINDYLPGQGIRPHFDRKDYFDNTIIGISLGSDCVMEFTSPDKQKVNVYIPRRSLYVLEDDARYEWLHGIAGRKTDKLGNGKVLIRSRRISITFRNVIQSKVKRTLASEMANAVLKLK